jgi:hypothetical protein
VPFAALAANRETSIDANLDPVVRYFDAERAESIVFIAVGMVALALAVWGWRVVKEPFAVGAAVPLVLIAAIQLTVGGTIFARTPKDVARVQQLVAQDKPRLRSEEMPRMQKVMKDFATYRWVEIALLVLGMAMLIAAARGSAWQGAGAGLALQSALMLGLDVFAERRGQAYLDWLRSIAGAA